MKKIIFISVFYILGLNVYSQLFEYKTNFSFGYSSGMFAGNELFNNEGTISPAFYSNLTSNNGIVVKYIFNPTPIFGLGLKLKVLNSTNWQSENYVSYDGSESNIINVQPVFQIHNKFSETGIFNRLKLYGEISPVIAYSTLHVKNNLFDIRGYEINSDVFIEKKIIYGLEAGVGCEYAFTNKTGAFLDVSVQEGFVDSPLFLDNRYTFIGLNLGVRINITKVKRFNY